MATVVVASHFGEEHLQEIRAAGGDRVRVLYDGSAVPPPRFDSDHAGPPGWRRPPEAEDALLSMLAEAEVLLDFPRGHVNDLTRVAPNLRWVQGSMAGAGEVAEKAGLLQTGVVVTTASGVFSGPLAEFALGAMLHHAKRFERLRRDKEERRWRDDPVDTLEGKTLCLVGVGSIGRAVSERARPFGMRVIGVKRIVRDDDPAHEHADELFETSHLHEVLARADYAVASLPLTPQTEGLLDAQAIEAMKPGAFFVNVGRGKVVDEAALVDALAEGRISGAALDVFAEEPLPEESPLWGMENVIVSPHGTDNVVGLSDRLLVDLFCENLRRYLAGEPMLNVLDKERLY